MLQKYLKPILGFTAFILGLLILLHGLSLLFVPERHPLSVDVEEQFANGIQSEPVDSIDVVVLGDSESYSSISPLLIWKDTGYTCYVCGSSRQYLSYSKTLLERAFETQSPKLVILETLCIYRQIPTETMLMDRASQFLPILRYHDRWKYFLQQGFGQTPPSETYTSPYKGHRLNRKVSGITPSGYMSESTDAAEIPLRNRILVEQMRDMCQEHGARLLLLSTPSTVNWNYQRHNGIAALSEDLGVEFIDLNTQPQAVQIDWSTDTYDRGDHLNHAGCVKVSQFLARYLADTQLFSDRRRDSRYDNWNAILQVYENEIAQN